MEENFSHVIYIVACTLLFAMAVSFALLSYNQLSYRAENYFKTMSITGYRGDGTGFFLETDDLKRKVSFDEIYFSIVGLPAYSYDNGNEAATVTIVSNRDYVFRGFIDPVTNHKIVLCDINDEQYDLSNKDDVNNLLMDLSAFCFGVSSYAYNSNDILIDKDFVSENAKNTFSIEYTENEIRYIKN